MERVLADALLVQSRDPGALLAALCDGEASADRAETLRLVLRRLEERGAGAGADALAEAAREVAVRHLVPWLRASATDGPPGSSVRVQRAAGAALRSCDALRELPCAPAAEVLAAVGPSLRALEDAPLLRCLARAAVELVLAGDAPPPVTACLLPALAQCAEPALRAAWDALGPSGTPGRVGPELQVLSALVDKLLPQPGARHAGPDARLYSRFWKTVQAGLGRAPDALSRKYARHLLLRAVEVSAELAADCTCGDQDETGPTLFWWSEKKKEELLKFWENYILIMETLEGNQIHVIKPVLPKLNSLFEYAFIIGPLMDALSESSLYSRSPGQPVGGVSPLGLKLQKFLVTHISLLPEETKSCFLLKFIQRMADRHWCAVPILFLSRALANVPRCKALGREGLLALRNVLQRTMITHQVLLRGVAQCCLLQTAMSLVDVLLVLRRDKSSQRTAEGFGLWSPLCDWLCVNERNFRQSSMGDADGQHKTSLNAYVKNLVQEFVKSPGWESGESCFTPDWLEARLAALTVLLAVDVDGMKTQFSEKQRTQNVLRSLLDPLLDALGKLGTNAYMPLLRTDRCLQLLLKLLHTCMPRGPSTQEDEVLTLLQTFVTSVTESISQFVLRRLTMSELQTVADLDRCQLYLQVLAELTSLQVKLGWKAGNPVSRIISPLKNSCIRHLQEAESGQLSLSHQVHRVVGMATLAALCEAVDQHPLLQQDSPDAEPVDRLVSVLPLSQPLQKPHAEEQNRCAHPSENGSVFEEPSSSQGWGKVVTQYIHDQWVCLSFLLRKYHTLIPATDSDIPDHLLPAVQKPVRTLQSALDALAVLPADHVLPVFHCIEVLVPKLLTSMESLCIESFDMAWKITSSLSNTQLTFWPNLKAFIHFVFDNKVLTIAAKLKGQAYFKIKEVTFCYFSVWLVASSSAQLGYCYCYIKDLKLPLILSSLFTNVVGGLTLISSPLLQDESVSKTRTHYYENSLQHRVKNRLWQTLLVLFPRFDQNFLNEIIDQIFQAGFTNNQASVKYFVEWIIILILHKFPQFLPKFWDCFSYGEEKLKTSICTFLSVLSHLDIITQNIPEKKLVLKQALTVALQWCLSHNFSVRLYALVALKKVWHLCKVLRFEECDAWTTVIECSLSQAENMHGA
uniref:TAR RNA binding protein 1 n=1 Tax=Nannospalax galili TaxID=1026970 RepID=A0A8C6W604_NANGA